jgi:hypothetical protein
MSFFRPKLPEAEREAFITQYGEAAYLRVEKYGWLATLARWGGFLVPTIGVAVAWGMGWIAHPIAVAAIVFVALTIGNSISVACVRRIYSGFWALANQDLRGNRGEERSVVEARQPAATQTPPPGYSYSWDERGVSAKEWLLGSTPNGGSLPARARRLLPLAVSYLATYRAVMGFPIPSGARPPSLEDTGDVVVTSMRRVAAKISDPLEEGRVFEALKLGVTEVFESYTTLLLERERDTLPPLQRSIVGEGGASITAVVEELVQRWEEAAGGEIRDQIRAGLAASGPGLNR